MTTEQRRRWERYRKELDVVITRADGTSVPGRTQDICERGIGVECSETLDVGSDYNFAIADMMQTSLVGTVRWCTPAPARGVNVVGVELTRLTAQQAQVFAECIARWKSEDPGRVPGSEDD